MTATGAPVMRHRTAMVRHSLSQPMSLLVQHGVLAPGVAVFDYGCGQGDDLRALVAAGLDARGWDPHFAPDNARQEADVVNLGFVLNVIEDARERRDALRDAWQLARGVLAVSTMIAGQVSTEGLRSYRDGFLTSRGTFQKYFGHAELGELVADVTGTQPVAAAPGIFFAFRRADDLEEFLLRRRMGRRSSTAAYRAPRERRATSARPLLADRIAPALNELAELAQMRGRMPVAEEVPPAVMALLSQHHVALPRALDLMASLHLDPATMEQAAMAMREDLLVHFALARLNQRQGADRLGGAIVRDIRAHFGSQKELLAESGAYLMGLADVAAVDAAIAQAATGGIGALDPRGRLFVDAGRREDLPGVLRVYLGCAAYLAGEPGDNSLVRIDSQRKIVAYIPLDDPKSAAPFASSIIKIDLKRQAAASQPTRRRLIAKSRISGRSTRGQLGAEAALREELGVGEEVLIVRL